MNPSRLRPLTAALFFTLGSAAVADQKTTDRAAAFVAAHEKAIRPLEIAAAQAWWTANITGSDADYKAKEEAQNAIDKALSDRDVFAELKALKAAKDKGELADKILAREIDVLYLQYLEKQVDPKLLGQISRAANEVEKKFNVFRANVDGKEMTDSVVRKTLKKSTDSAFRQAVWEASKKVGASVEADLKELVKLRNEMAKELGFKNFHALMLHLNEQNGDDLIKLFDELDELTRDPFKAAKADIDERLGEEVGDQGRRVDAVALPRPVLPGVAGRLRRQPRRPVPEGRHPETVQGLLRRHRPADRATCSHAAT